MNGEFVNAIGIYSFNFFTLIYIFIIQRKRTEIEKAYRGWERVRRLRKRTEIETKERVREREKEIGYRE